MSERDDSAERREPVQHASFSDAAPDEVLLASSERFAGRDPFGEGRRSTWRVALVAFLVTVALLNVAWLVAGERIAGWVLAGGGGAAADSGVTWTCPMHPSVVSDKASTCPVCAMDLVPLLAEGSEMSPEARAAVARVSAAPTQQLVGDYKTVALEQSAPPGESLEVFGQVELAEDHRATVTTWIAGRIDALLVQETGTVVESGQAVARIYSETLSSAQEEYLAALEGGAFAQKLVEASERKLRLYGMSSGQIARLKKRGRVAPEMTIRAAQGGTIMRRLVHQGQYVSEGQVLFEVAELSTLWVDLDVPEARLGLVRVGQVLQFRVENAPQLGELEGRVDFIHPFVNPSTQTVAVRLVVDNAAGALSPQMLVRASLEGAAHALEAQLLVPRSAVVHTGERTLVWVEIAPRTFEPRQITLARRIGRYHVVESGLAGHERVVEHAGFLLDPESPMPAPEELRMVAALHDAEATGRLHLFGHVGAGEFFCPMHPQVHQHGAGRCPQCNMDLIEMTPALRRRVDGSDPIAALEPGTWYCPMGAEHVGDAPGRCPQCNMKLVEKQADDGAGLVDDPIDTVPAGEWYCPMGAEWVQDGPGTCPLCKMKLVQQGADAGAAHAGHDHAGADPTGAVPPGSWYCPMDAEWVQDGPGPCPLCGMDLVVKEGTAPAPKPAAHGHPNHPGSQVDPIGSVPPGSWYCPMDAEWVQGTAGPCPICGMDLVQKSEDAQ